MSKHYTARKYEGDDEGSWAVFKKSDLKGLRGVIFSHQATPIISGLTHREVPYYIEQCEKRLQEKENANQN